MSSPSRLARELGSPATRLCDAPVQSNVTVSRRTPRWLRAPRVTGETKHKTSVLGRARLVRRDLPPPSLSWGSTVSHTRWGSTVTVRGSRSH